MMSSIRASCWVAFCCGLVDFRHQPIEPLPSGQGKFQLFAPRMKSEQSRQPRECRRGDVAQRKGGGERFTPAFMGLFA